MKTIKSYIIGLAAALTLSGGLVSCQDDFDDPAANAPAATNQANTTIAEFKEAFWQDDTNYAVQVGTRDDGSHYIIKGRVVSSDEDGNIFKNISIQDETGAITFSINSYNLYLKYRRGQEIVVDATGMYVGKYAGLMQFGTPSYYENGSTWQVGFMSPEFFQQHVELNGFPEIEKLDTITVNSTSVFDTSAEGLRRWQSQLVRINNVHFPDGGEKTFSEYHSNTNDDVNKTLIDSQGNQIIVRTSGYANFWNEKLPTESGDIVGVLSFYQSLSGSSMWQLMLNDIDGCMNFGNPTIASGSEQNPYTVPEVVAIEAAGQDESGWVSGYIVGSVAPGVETVSSNDDIEWSGESLMPYTLVIGAEKETKDINSALVIELPADSPLRSFGNLRDNPDNYGKAISVRGTFAKVMGTYGVADNNGTTSEFKIEGVTTGSEAVADGDGTKDSPYNTTQLIAKNPSSTTTAVESGIWVKGYIVGYIPTGGTSTTLSMTVFGVDDAVASNIVIAPTPDETDYNKCVPVQLVSSTDPRSAVNLKDHPENIGKAVSLHGDIMKYCGAPGLKNTDDYVLEGGTGTPVTPVTPTGTVTLGRVSTITAGKRYAIGIDANCMAPLSETYTYGYLPVATATASGNQVTLDAVNTWTIESTTGGYALKDCYGRYIYQTGSYNSFNVATSLPESGGVWTITFNTNKTARITNVATGKTIQYSANYSNYGAYSDVTDSSLPYIYLENGTGEDTGGDTPATPVSNTIFSETFLNGNLGQFTTTVETTGSWTGWRANTGTTSCAIANSYVNSANEAATAWLISPEINLSGATTASISLEQAFGFYFPTAQEQFCTVNIREKGGQWQALTLTNYPAKGSGNWTSFAENSIDIASFAGKAIQIGFKYVNDGKQSIAWEIKNFSVKADAGSVTPGGDTPTEPDDPTPVTPTGDYKGDFNTFNNGTTKTTYGTYTNSTGWTAENCAILGGYDGDGDGSNPNFKFIGAAGTLAPTLNGNTTKIGKLTSATLTGGCKTLTFNYGFAFADTKCKFTVKILQGSSVVKEDTVTLDAINQKTAYDYSLDVNVNGDFSIEIVNECYSNSSSNKDRVSIWNLTWTN